MQPWFIFKNRNSYSEGLWISKLPEIVRAAERYTTVTIPGRAGKLTMLEGEDVCDDYIKECVVTCPTEMDIQKFQSWLFGSGDVIFSNEDRFAYEARIVGQVSFQRIGNSLQQATIPFLVKPFKKERYPKSITISTSGTIVNPGDIASRPIVTVTGGTSVTIAGNQMTFGGSGTLKVDCENKIVTKNGALFTGTVTGDFWTIPVGSSSVTGNFTIDPCWRWR